MITSRSFSSSERPASCPAGRINSKSFTTDRPFLLGRFTFSSVCLCRLGPVVVLPGPALANARVAVRVPAQQPPVVPVAVHNQQPPSRSVNVGRVRAQGGRVRRQCRVAARRPHQPRAGRPRGSGRAEGLAQGDANEVVERCQRREGRSTGHRLGRTSDVSSPFPDASTLADRPRQLTPSVRSTRKQDRFIFFGGSAFTLLCFVLIWWYLG